MRSSLLRAPRRAAGRVKRALFPRPEVAALRRLERAAATAPRRAPGTIEAMGLRLRYPDLLTLCPQWRSIFIEESLRFECAHESPRILDCGANVGLASLYFKRLFPAASITAFEADPEIFALLRANLDANGAGDVGAVQAAVWTADGTVEFLQEGADSGAVAAVARGVAGVPAAVPAVRLRRLLAGGPPVDLLKLDVEGAELALLEDCADALSAVRALVIDLHEFDPEHRLAPRLLALLERAGFHYAQSELVPLSAPGNGPFPRASARWATLIHAWRPAGGAAAQPSTPRSDGEPPR